MRYKKWAKGLLIALTVFSIAEFGLTALFIGHINVVTGNRVFHEAGFWAGDDFENRLFSVGLPILIVWWVFGCVLPYYLAFVKYYDFPESTRLFVVLLFLALTVIRAAACVNNAYHFMLLLEAQG